jgi:histidinol-phosphate aminotransferase
VRRVVEARTSLASALASLPGFEVTSSDANFLWVKTPRPAEQLFDRLVADGILVRSFHKLGGRLAHQLRITIGSNADHDRLLASLHRATC